MQIFKCKDSDIARVGAFYDSVVKWLDAHINYPEWICGTYPSEGSVREHTAAGTQYYCEEDQQICGAFSLDANPMENYKTVKWANDLPTGSFLIVHAMAVGPDHQRMGAGADILQFCIDRAVAEGYKAIRADIVTTNRPARRFFEKNGFAYAGEMVQEVWPGSVKQFSMYELNL